MEPRKPFTQHDYKAHRALQKVTDPDAKERLRELLALQRQRSGLHQRFLEEARQLKHKYEQLYRPIYDSQAAVIRPLPGFWLEVLKKSAMIGPKIRPAEEPFFEAVIDIRCLREGEGETFFIEFEFKANDFIEAGVFRKSYFMSLHADIERIEASQVRWKAVHEDLMKATEDPDSFLHFFASVEMPDAQELDTMDSTAVSTMGKRIEEDYDTACELRDELVPNAVFYYLDSFSKAPEERKRSSRTEVSRRKGECPVQ